MKSLLGGHLQTFGYFFIHSRNQKYKCTKVNDLGEYNFSVKKNFYIQLKIHEEKKEQPAKLISHDPATMTKKETPVLPKF